MTQLELFSLVVAAALLAVAAAVTLYARRSPTADSPWFWVCLFSMGATVALYVMEGKYNHRQAHIEDQYRYGTKSLQRPATPTDSQTTNGAGSNASSSSHAAGTTPDASPLASGPQPPTHDLYITLAPLRTIAIATMTVSWIVLQFKKKRPGGEPTPSQSAIAEPKSEQ
jgi:hypothetical protein